MSDVASQAVISHGTELQIGDGGTPTELFTKVADLISIKETGAKLDLVEVSTLESPNSVKEYITGMRDGGSIQVEGNYTTDAQQAAVEAAFDGATKKNFKLVIPFGTPKTWAFSGIVTDLAHDFAPTAAMKFTATIKMLTLPTKS
jgi:hypothetical protein